MQKKIKNTSKYIFLILMLFVLIVPATYISATENPANIFEQYQQYVDTFDVTMRFDNFLLNHEDAPRPMTEYVISAADYTLVDGMSIRLYQDVEGVDGISVWTDEEGLIQWEVNVAQGGLYHMAVKYYSVEGKNSTIQRAILINGQLPYFEAGTVNFYRTWVNQLDYIQQDNQGNDLRPTQIEEHLWREIAVRDAMREHNEYLSFYLQPGLNTITFISQREPMIINSIRLFNQADTPSYLEYSANLSSQPRPDIEDIRIEGQASTRRSSATLAPRINMSGPGVYPYDPRLMRVNYIGGDAWRSPGDWIEWNLPCLKRDFIK